MERTPLCSVKFCPAPKDPEWHRCVVCGKFIASIQRIGGEAEVPRRDMTHAFGLERAIDYSVALKVAGDIYAAAITQGFVQAVPGASEVTAYAKALMSD